MNIEQKSELEKKISFIMSYGSALHGYGAPAHRLERAMSNVSIELGLKGEFFCTPTAIMASFDTPIGRRPAITRTEPGSIELGKMILTDKVGDAIIDGEIDHREGQRRVSEILNSACAYGSQITTLSYGLISVVSLFKGGFNELLISFLIGLVVGGISILTKKDNAISRIFETAAAFFVMLISSALFYYYPEFSTQIVIVSSLIILIPGLPLTIAVEELATNNLVSGTARLMHALVIFFKIGFGVVIGNELAIRIFPSTESILQISQIPFFLEWGLILIAPLAFTIAFKARFKDAPWIFIAGVLGIISSKFGSSYFGPELGAFVGGFVVGLGSNLYAKLKHKPAAVTLLPGIILLVPGSIGFKGLKSMLEHDTLVGLDLAFDMLIIATALVAGLLLANIFISSKRSL